MQLTQSINLNLSIDGIPPRLHMPQGDSNTRAIVAVLWDGAQPCNIPTDAAVMVRFRKPDGTGGLYDTTETGSKVTFSGNTVTVPVATQMLAVPGIVMAEINIYAPGSYAPINSRGDVNGDGVVTQDDLEMLARHLSGTQPLEDASNADANGDGVIDAKDLTYMSQRLDKAAKQLSSFAFALCVTPCVYPDASIISSDYYNILSVDIAKVLTIATYPPIIGENGNWFFWDTSAKKYTDTGKTSKGADGTTPHIGANGNWYLGETDTGLPSRGEQGPGAEVFYVDLEGSYPDYTCPVAMADIKAAYEAGKVLECRCAMGRYTATLPLFVPMPSANTWIFSGSGALAAMNFPAQSLTIAIVNGAVQASNTQLATEEVASPTHLGLVQPVAKTDAMTRSIGVDDNGVLYSEPAAWYVNITGTLDAPIGDKTPAEIYQAYTEGYAVYAVVQMTNLYSGMPFMLPLVAIVSASGSYLVCFSTLAEPHRDGTGIIEITVTWNQQWYLFTSKIASTDDIPTALKNPNALTITCGSTTVTYDGSEAKTIDIPAGVGDDTPDYVLTAADALAKKVVNHIGADNIVFAVMADAHLGYYTDTGNAAGKQAGQALKRLNERCALDFVAHVGDYTTGAYNTTVESAMRDMADYQLLIGSKFPGRQAWCVGNHDDAPYQATANRMSQTQVYAAISRKNLASNGYVPGNAAYGYMDFPALRLRLIYLDTHDRRSWGSAQVGAGENCAFLNVENISAAQLQWLADHALNFSGVDDPSKWSILVFSHAVLSTSGTYTDPGGTVHPCNTANAATLLKAYATKKSGSITHGGVTVNYNFTAVTPAGIIGCIHGHEHRYANETVGGAFLSICCPNIMNGRERVSADGNTYTKTAGTANGTSFCVFSINRADKKIYVDHYGPGVDRVFDYTVIDPSAPSYTNLLPSAIDTDGSIYNGVGWEKGYRLGSDGAPSGQNDSYLTGFIPVKFGDVVHLKNVKWQNGVTTGLNSGNQRISFYSADKAHLAQTNAIGLGGTLSGVKDENGIWTQFTVKNWSGVDLGNAAYFRLNCAEISGDSIITANEEIT